MAQKKITNRQHKHDDLCCRYNSESLIDVAERQETKFQKYWRPACAGVYLFLVVVDYAVRPAINYLLRKDFDLANTVAEIINLDPAVQVKIIETVANAEAITPILPEFVHLAFGAILGAAAYTRGKEKIARLQNGKENGH